MQSVVKAREALEELTKTEGWRLFVIHVMNEWTGPGYRQRMKTALNSEDNVAPRVVDRAADEMIRLLQWPTDQIGELKGWQDE